MCRSTQTVQITCFGNLDLHRSVQLLLMSLGLVSGIFERRCEQGIDKGGLAIARLTADHDGKVHTFVGYNLVSLIRQMSNANGWLRAVG